MSQIKIRCPKCRWEPSVNSQWYCDKCSHIWNTFDTGGKCPGCGHVHRYTQCPRCHKMSPHAEWYDWGEMDGEFVVEEEVKEVVVIEK